MPQRLASRKDWAGLAVLALAVLLIAIDATVLDVALPAISADLEPSSTQLLWIVDIYSFILAGLLVTMGTIGDRIGRRRLLLLGATGFAAASVLAGLSTSAEMLIAARVLLGVAGATLMPSTLGLIRAMFPDDRQRVLAIGVWGAMAGGGTAAGPLLGGWLLEHYWWGSVFLVNLPVMLVLLIAGPLLIPESKDPEPGRFDLVSSLLSMAAILPVVYAVKEAVVGGAEPYLLVVALVGVVAGWLFVRRQGALAAARDRGEDRPSPMIDMGLFRLPAFSTAVVTNLLSIFAIAGVLFFGSQYLQLVLGYSPLEAGLLMLPGMIANGAMALAAAWLVRRWTVRSVLASSLVVAAVGTAVMLAIGVDSSPAPFVLGFVLGGAGSGVALTLTSDLVVGSVPERRAGAASAVSETAYELGVALGVAVLGSVVMAAFRRGLDSSVFERVGLGDHTAAAEDTLGSAMAEGQLLPEPEREHFLAEAASSFVTATHIGVATTSVILVLTAALAWRMLRPKHMVDAKLAGQAE